MSGDSIQATGVVEEEFRGGFHRVRVGAPLNREVLCRLSGRLAKNRIRVLPGDTVEVEVSPYDVSRGRITYRGVRRGG